MKLLKWLATSVALAALGLSSATAADKAKQDEVLKAAQTSLNDFYKADPKVKGEVEKAPGYAVFTTYGLSFLIGGAGGKGVVHDNVSKKITYMDMALASAGLQIGAAQTRYLFIFKDAAQMQQFIDKGWEASANISGGRRHRQGHEWRQHGRLHRRQVLSADEDRPGSWRGCPGHQGLERQGPELVLRLLPKVKEARPRRAFFLPTTARLRVPQVASRAAAYGGSSSDPTSAVRRTANRLASLADSSNNHSLTVSICDGCIENCRSPMPSSSSVISSSPASSPQTETGHACLGARCVSSAQSDAARRGASRHTGGPRRCRCGRSPACTG